MKKPKLDQLQRQFFQILTQPLTPRYRTRRTLADGRSTTAVAQGLVTANSRMSAIERIELYNRQYWFRLMESFMDDFPGLMAVLGERRFDKLMFTYLQKYPSRSWSLITLGQHLRGFINSHPKLTAPHTALAFDMARLEWAQIEAFSAEELPPLSTETLQSTPPSRLRIGLQPHVRLLHLHHAADDFLVSYNKEQLRNDASHTLLYPPRPLRQKLFRRAKSKDIFVAVHRHDFRVYFKRLDPDAFALLSSLRDGIPLQKAFDTVARKAHLSPEEWSHSVQMWFADWSSLRWLTPFQKTRKPKS